jgi:hypothetical protein
VEIEHWPAIKYVIVRVFDTFKNASPLKDAAENAIAARRAAHRMRRRSGAR